MRGGRGWSKTAGLAPGGGACWDDEHGGTHCLVLARHLGRHWERATLHGSRAPRSGCPGVARRDGLLPVVDASRDLLLGDDVSLEAAAVAVVLICCAVGGAIGVAGVLVGLLVARRFREMPRVKCVASDWDMTDYEGAGPLRRVVCSFEVD